MTTETDVFIETCSIILSRHRDEAGQKQDRQLAEKIVASLGLSTLLVPPIYDLRGSSRIFEQLRYSDQPRVFLAPIPVRAAQSLLKERIGAKNEHVYIDTSTEDVDSILSEIRRRYENKQSAPEIREWNEMTAPRWYPIIDVQECIGCLECVNFCLFGVYIIGEGDLPLVDQPDACRDGCPACSRICPGAAIMFPMHEDPNISGRIDPAIVRSQNSAQKADEERQKHLNKEEKELDGLVDLIDEEIT